MKKRALTMILTLITVASTLLSGCGAKDNSAPSDGSTGSESKSGDKVSIRILTRIAGTDPKSLAFQSLIKKFMEENPNITVVDESLNDEAAFNNKLKTSVATGNVPEIWMNYGGVAFKDYAKNIAMDLQPVIDEDKTWSDAFLPLFGTWQFTDFPGTYGVPNEFYSVAIYYNKDLFQQINAAPPTTIEEFEAVAEKFKGIGVVPMAMADKDNFRGGHLLTNLSLKKYGFQKTEDLMSGTAKWNDPDMVSLLELMKSWQDKGIFGKNMNTTDGNQITSMFLSGKSAMMFEGVWAISSLASSPLADKIGVIPFPGFSDKPDFKDNWFGGAGGYSVSKAVEGAKKDATIKLLKYLTSVDASKLFLKETKGGVYPVKMDIDPASLDPVTAEYIKAQSTAKDFKGEIEEYSPIMQLQDKVRNEIQGMFAGNDAQKTADTIQKFVESNTK
jgi:raffinose/stachyose/melibiose transport system substrate-binding protein